MCTTRHFHEASWNSVTCMIWSQNCAAGNQQAQIAHNNQNGNGQGKAQHRKHKRLKHGSGQAHNSSNDLGCRCTYYTLNKTGHNLLYYELWADRRLVHAVGKQHLMTTVIASLRFTTGARCQDGQTVSSRVTQNFIVFKGWYGQWLKFQFDFLQTVIQWVINIWIWVSSKGDTVSD
jgi:hypothetical protein